MDWPAMVWIGGTPGAGKSTLARWLANTHDLPLHPIDAWTYDHVQRMPPPQPLDMQLAAGAKAAADKFEASSRTRLSLVVADIVARGLGDVPAVVEGPQLLPSLAEPLPPGWAIWLITDPAQTRRARVQRWGQQERLDALVRRDTVLTERIRLSASDAGLPVIDVPVDPDWPVVAAAVEDALAPALADAARLNPGEDMRNQRRLLNRAVCRQIRLWRQDAGLAALSAYEFACECGQSGCQATWHGTPDDYDARTKTGPLLADDHATPSA